MKRSDFDKLVARTRLEGNAVQAARLILVDGETVTAAGAVVGISRQAAQAAVRRVLEEIGKKSWRRVCVYVPAAVARKIRAIEKEEQSR